MTTERDPTGGTARARYLHLRRLHDVMKITPKVFDRAKVANFYANKNESATTLAAAQTSAVRRWLTKQRWLCYLSNWSRSDAFHPFVDGRSPGVCRTKTSTRTTAKNQSENSNKNEKKTEKTKKKKNSAHCHSSRVIAAAATHTCTHLKWMQLCEIRIDCGRYYVGGGR